MSLRTTGITPSHPLLKEYASSLAEIRAQGYSHDDDGQGKNDNIKDAALAEFHKHYADKAITKWDIFYYVYAILTHPAYKQKFATELKRELPRIPFSPNFKELRKAGQKLADLPMNYEDLEVATGVARDSGQEAHLFRHR